MFEHTTDDLLKFGRDGFLFLPGVLSPTEACALERLFHAQLGEGTITATPSKYANRSNYYGCKLFNALLVSLLPVIEDVIGEPLWPTFSFARVYRTGSSLEPHVDRAACEITATITIATSVRHPWPLFLRTKAGAVLGMAARSGDLVLFSGAELTHWRERFEGDQQLQVFLHYVRQNGEFSHLRFDAGRGGPSDGKSANASSP